MISFRFIDLFAGIGGFRLGLEPQGGDCVFSSEWDSFAQKTYQANFGDMPQGDITKISVADLPDFDILTAGFPCQPFSSIGKRQGFEHPSQGTLFFDVWRILKAKAPKAFILENVEGLVNHDKGKTLSVIFESLALSVNGQSQPHKRKDRLNYHVFWKILDAKDYGLPQKRKRIFIVGLHEDLSRGIPNFSFPEAFAQQTVIAPYIEANREGYSISEHLQKTYLFKLNDGKPEIIDQNSYIQVKTLVSTYHKIQRLTGTFVRDGKTGLRLLSEQECKAIMGFPPEFKIPVSRTQMYRQFGNSVAVPVVTEVAKAVVSQMTNLASLNLEAA